MTRREKLFEETTLPEAFHHMIPAHAVVAEELTKLSASYLRTRYETAIAMRTGDPVLASDELKRFSENCKIIGVVTLGIELRNYLLWEVYSTEQFRESDQDFESFGRHLTARSAAQLWKSVHAGRIRIAMIQASLDDVGPTGRQVEELSKIESEHTVRAWSHTLEYLRNHGKSESMVKEALLDYCKKEGIKYGKRLPNGSRKLGLPKIGRSRKAKKMGGASSNELNPVEDCWSLSPNEEQIFLELIPCSVRTGDATGQKEHVSRSITALRKVASLNPSNEYTTSQMQALLALVARKEGETARVLMNVLYEKLRELIMQEIQDGDTHLTKPLPETSSCEKSTCD